MMGKLAGKVCRWCNAYKITDLKDFLEHLRVEHPEQYRRIKRILEGEHEEE